MDQCNCEQQECHGEAYCSQTATQTVPTIYGDFRMCDRCAAHMPPEFRKDTWPRYINVLLVDKKYGGPEEGGWWYETRERVATVCVEKLDEFQAMMSRVMGNQQWSNEGRPDTSSVLSRGQFRIEVTYGSPAPEFEPTERPRYE